MGLRWVILVGLLVPGLARAEEALDISQASQTLQLAGFPALPAKAKRVQCQSWSGQSAGVYATFTFVEPATLEAYLASLPPGLNKASPIPANLLSPPLAEASWFAPPRTAKAYVLYRGRIWHGAPETFRLYVDPEKWAVYLYYTWNNKHTYP